MRHITLAGYFAVGDVRPVPARLNVTISGYGLNEQLTIDCVGRYPVTVSYNLIERLCRALRQDKSAPELSGRLPGTGSGGKKGEATAWMRRSEGFEMLTLELDGMGQISVSFHPIESMVRAERSTRA